MGERRFIRGEGKGDPLGLSAGLLNATITCKMLLDLALLLGVVGIETGGDEEAQEEVEDMGIEADEGDEESGMPLLVVEEQGGIPPMAMGEVGPE